jgi:hypothetical protein
MIVTREEFVLKEYATVKLVLLELHVIGFHVLINVIILTEIADLMEFANVKRV